MAGGKIVKIAGKKIIQEYETLTCYNENFTINAGEAIELTTDAEMICGDPEEPKTGGKYIIRGWWSSDRDGLIKIHKACLGDTVFFQIETKNIPIYNEANDVIDEDLSRLHISFYDLQLGYMGFDFIASDRKIKGGPKYAYINEENRACVPIKILYNDLTIDFVKEDNTPGDIEIYCVAEYKPSYSIGSINNNGPVYQKESLPVSFRDYLSVGLPDIPDLYFIKPGINYQFPEIRSSEGNVIYLQLLLSQEDYTQKKIDQAKEKIKGKIKGVAKDAMKEATAKALDKFKEYSYTLAIRELEKGSLMYTDGRVIHRKNVYDTDITMIDGNVRNIKRASNTGFRVAHPTLQGDTHYATTLGLNQLEVFAQSHPVHTAANLSTKIFETLSFVIDVKEMEQSLSTGTPDYKGLGNLALKKFFGFFPSWVGKMAGYLSIAVDLLVDQYSKDLEELLEEQTIMEFLKKKEEGMESMKDFLQFEKTNKNLLEEKITELGFRFLSISTLTLQKLLAKEFNTLEELKHFESGLYEKTDSLHGIVFRGIWNQYYKRYDNFIYCIFIDEKSLDV